MTATEDLYSFFKEIASKIDAHFIEVLSKDKQVEHEIHEAEELNKVLQVEDNRINLSQLRRVVTKKRKTNDCTKLDVLQCQSVTLYRMTSCKDLTGQQFADKMNKVYNVDKSANSWFNLVNKRTAYYKKLDY